MYNPLASLFNVFLSTFVPFLRVCLDSELIESNATLTDNKRNCFLTYDEKIIYFFDAFLLYFELFFLVLDNERGESYPVSSLYANSL